MTQSLYATAWDAHSTASYVAFNDYLALDHHYSPASGHILDDARPSSSSSSITSLAAPKQLRPESESWQSSDLYQFPINDTVDSPLTSPEPELDPPRVKQEDNQDDFVFEVPAVTDATMTAYPAFSSMTEVPLRATQASKEMRRMMGVFRLDPFTMHNAVRDPTANLNWNGEPIGPLREEPVMLEFQLQIAGDRVKSEPPTALYLATDDSEGPARKRRRVSSSYAPERSPTPEVAYPYTDSPSSSPIDDRGHTWSNSSADSHSLGYPSDVMRQSSAFDTVLTPAQGLDATLGMGYGSKYASASPTSTSASLRMPTSMTSLSSITKHSQPSRSPLHHSSLSYASTDSPPLSYLAPSPPAPSSSPSFIHPSSSVSSSSLYSSSMSPSYSSSSYVDLHHSQTRASLAYTTTSPVRLPPPASSRYVMHPQDLGALGHGVEAAVNSIDEGTNSMWARKVASLGMFYGNGKDAAVSHSSTAHADQGLSLAQPHTASALASRRMASAVGVGAHGGITRAGRAAWA